MADSVGERMVKLETDITYIKNRVDSMVAWQESLDRRYDERYASKTVEKLMYGGVAVVLTAVLGAVIYLVAAQPHSLIGG
jgi:hypothetical protein